MAQAVPRPSGALENEQPPLSPDKMPEAPEEIVGVMVVDEGKNEIDDGEGEKG
jgi:hypothetical protein